MDVFRDFRAVTHACCADTMFEHVMFQSLKTKPEPCFKLPLKFFLGQQNQTRWISTSPVVGLSSSKTN